MANSHPESYCGQDAYSDMFVTEKRYANELGWHTDSSNIDTEQCKRSAEDAGQRKFQLCYRGRGTEQMETVVRRLTPTECERLQGFPDGWTDIGDWTDSKGRVHKGDADAPRYKALGNSIATPFWFYLLRRISATYERPATLGSLFDGIGGFPYCWEKCNGQGSAIWASEIEEFPIAVTKIRFPEGD